MTSVPVLLPRVSVRVPAKVNLELRVGPRRADGYHELATVYQAVGLYDLVEVTHAPQWGIELTGRTREGVPGDASNLAVRAAQALADHAGVDTPVHLRVTKEIPVAGGMAGGSADAAGALVACARLWGLDLPAAELEGIAAGLGSDIPFLISGGTALGSGRGEHVVPVLTRGKYHWVFALSTQGLSTPSVYAECDRLRAATDVTAPEPDQVLLAALAAGDRDGLAGRLANDLQDAAISLQPDLGEVLEAGLGFGALGGIVSGSGPTVAFLVRTAEAAIDLAVALAASGTAADVRRAVGPVPGATIEAAAAR